MTAIPFRGTLSRVDVERAERIVAGRTARPEYSTGPMTILGASYLGVFLIVLLEATGWRLHASLVVLGFVIGVGILQSARSVRQFRRRKDPVAEVGGELSDAGVTYDTGFDSHSIPWREIDAVRSSGRVLVLDGRGRRFVLARSLFGERDAWRAAVRLARERVTTKLTAKSRRNVRVFVGGIVLVAVVAIALFVAEHCFYP